MSLLSLLIIKFTILFLPQISKCIQPKWFIHPEEPNRFYAITTLWDNWNVAFNSSLSLSLFDNDDTAADN